MAGYWLFTALVGLALVVWVHFVPTGDYEAPIEDIYAVYGSPLAGLLALVVLVGLVFGLVTLAIAAIRGPPLGETPVGRSRGSHYERGNDPPRRRHRDARPTSRSAAALGQKRRTLNHWGHGPPI